MYFLSSIDPDYTIKGSRDPLGFQVIWQNAGRLLIPHLSTVSNSVTDFQILAFAYACKKKHNISETAFPIFFLRFEQLMAYTRLKLYNDSGFNGIDKVRKYMSNYPKEMKIGPQYQILSNQKAYGIWGKYNRPFSEMKLDSNEDFIRLYINKLESNQDYERRIKSFLQKGDKSSSHVEHEETEIWKEIIKKPDGDEIRLLNNHLLTDKCNNELFLQLKKIKGWEFLEFLELIDTLISSSTDTKFQAYLCRIKNTELTICPLNRIFRYLQTKAYWSFQEIEQDEVISRCRRKSYDDTGFDETLIHLCKLLKMQNTELVKGLVKRNAEISGKRNSAPWMDFKENGLEVYHFEGAYPAKGYYPERDNDFNYFFHSYTKLFKDLNLHGKARY